MLKLKHNVQVLLLLVVRDPVTRLISDYAQILENHRKRNLEYKSFEEAAFHANSGAPNRNYDAIQKVRLRFPVGLSCQGILVVHTEWPIWMVTTSR